MSKCKECTKEPRRAQQPQSYASTERCSMHRRPSCFEHASPRPTRTHCHNRNSFRGKEDLEEPPHLQQGCRLSLATQSRSRCLRGARRLAASPSLLLPPSDKPPLGCRRRQCSAGRSERLCPPPPPRPAPSACRPGELGARTCHAHRGTPPTRPVAQDHAKLSHRACFRRPGPAIYSGAGLMQIYVFARRAVNSAPAPSSPQPPVNEADLVKIDPVVGAKRFSNYL